MIVKDALITVAQAIALNRVFHRQPLAVYDEYGPTSLKDPNDPAMTFEEFVTQAVEPGSDCLMVRWCGMWLGIETDGHTHS